MTIKNKIAKAGMTIKKHSPAILTGAGIVGLGATAVLAYKARHKVEEVVEKIEQDREDNVEVNKMEVAVALTEALYLPVAVGTLSMTAIFASYKIQNNRIMTLAGALAAQQARNKFFEAKYKRVHGEEQYGQFMAPTEEEEVETGKFNKDGSAKTKIQEVQAEMDKTVGQWFEDSTEYAADDHSYNMAVIDAAEEKLQTILFQRGSLLLNEVREALGLERIRAGALIGWTTSDSFSLNKSVVNFGDKEKNDLKSQIWVSWSTPRYIYEDVEFNGRYSVL